MLFWHNENNVDSHQHDVIDVLSCTRKMFNKQKAPLLGANLRLYAYWDFMAVTKSHLFVVLAASYCAN